MATLETFNDMLNEYLPNKLLREELIKRDYVLTRVEKDNNWKGGTIVVPFKAAGASSVSFGSLTDQATVAQSKFIRGEITTPVEVWGTMIFNHTDIMKQDKVSEQNLLSVLPDTIEDFLVYTKEVVSNQLTCGPHFAKVTVKTGAGSGLLTVDRIEKFMLGQKFTLVDSDGTDVKDLYVINIDLNTSVITVEDTFDGTTPYDCSASCNVADCITTFPVAYYPGTDAAANQFVSIKSALLSAANGGSANLHGKVKTAYPFLQAINIDGSSIDDANLLDKIFDAYLAVRQKARGNANEVLMSYKNFGTAMKILELQKGAYKVTDGSRKASAYGWVEIEVQVVASSKALKFVGIQEMDDDVIFFMDWSGFTFRSNGFFKKRISPDGNQYFEIRATTGYAYVIDTCLFGQLECRTAGKCGVIYGIAY